MQLFSNLKNTPIYLIYISILNLILDHILRSFKINSIMEFVQKFLGRIIIRALIALDKLHQCKGSVNGVVLACGI